MARTPKPWYWSERAGWYVTIGGKRRKLAEGPKAKTKPAADREFHMLMLAEGKVETDRSRMKVKDLLDLYLLAVEGQVKRGEKSASTSRYYTQHIVSAVVAVGSKRVTEVFPRDFLDWAERDEWNQSTQHQALAVIKAAFGWGLKVGHLTSNPLAGMKLPAMKRREAIPTAHQVQKMMAKAWGQPFRDFLVALRESGCRPGEVVSLTADRVDLGRGVWWVKNKTRGKTGEEYRPVYLTPVLAEMTARLVKKHPEGLIFRNSRGGTWTAKSLADRFSRLRRRGDLGRECIAYSFRHLFVTDGLERGVPPTTMAELVGHKGLGMIMRHYCHTKLRTQHLRDAVRQVRPDDEPSAPGSPS